MPNLLVVAALFGATLLLGAASAQEAQPAEAPAESAETPAEEMPKEEAPAAEGDTTEPLPDIKADATTAENAGDGEPDAGAETEAPADDLRRPTEETDQSGKRVAAFWFISTGN